MEQGIFISYSNLDKKKLDLLVRELNLNGKYKPIVIASDREALKPLAKKVSDGLIKAEFVIPILTENSISNQWVNQEIGFATALNKTIIPIIDKDLINSLKGFIHKQVDLPYSFSSNTKAVTESKNFLKAVKNLISDLTTELTSNSDIVENPNLDLEESIKKLEKATASKQQLESKNQYLNSLEGMQDALTEAGNILFWADKKFKELNSRNIFFHWNKVSHLPKIEVMYGEFKFIILWRQQYKSQNTGAYLLIEKFKLDQKDDFVVIDKQVYTFDVTKEKQPVWLNTKSKIEKQSNELVTENINWLITERAKTI